MRRKSWPEAMADRLTWAEHSYETFVQKFDPSRASILRDNRQQQASVIVYGATQVGKTSLILLLLGISERHIGRVAKVLRGGSELGHSATSRSLRYRRARDNCWHFGHCDEGHTSFDDDAAEIVIQALRQHVESGVTSEFTCIDVFIPQQYYDAQSELAVDLLIHDLPGIHAANDNEKQYVARMVKQYINAADVILLVGKVDYLGFLKPEELESRELFDWSYNPTRYKIVLTHCYSDATIRSMIASEKINIPEELTDYLFQQINTLDFTLPSTVMKQIFPVECGRSWQQIVSANDTFSADCQRLRAATLESLFQSITDAIHPLSRLQHGYMLHIYFADQRKQEIEEFKRSDENLATKICHKTEELEIFHNQWKSLIKKEKQCNEYQDSLAFAIQQLFTCNAPFNEDAESTVNMPARFAPPSEYDPKEKDVDTLKRLTAQSLAAIQQGWSSWLELHHSLINKVPTVELENACLPLIRVKAKLDDYFFGSYLTDSRYYADRREVINSYHVAVDTLFSVSKQCVMAELKRTQKEVAARLKEIERQSENSLALSERLKEEIALASLEKDQLNVEHQHQLAQLDDLIASSRKFSNHIESSYRVRASEIQHQFLAAGHDRDQQLTSLLMMKVLNKDFDYIKSLQPMLR